MADRSVNVNNAKEMGGKIIKSMKVELLLDFSFKREDKIITMSSIVKS